MRGGLSAANLLFGEAPNKFAGDCPDGEYKCIVGDSEYYTFDYKGGLKNTRFGLIGGLFVEKTFTEKLALEVGLNYEQKGINLEYKSYAETRSGDDRKEEWRYYGRDIRNDYLVVPLVAKYKFNAASNYYLTAGMYTSFLIRSAGTAEDSSSINATNDEYRESMMVRMNQKVTKELTSTFDGGIVGGGGATWPLGNNLMLHIDARINVGVLKVDAKYNNRFEKQDLPSYMGFQGFLISESYYRGLNSQARNINLSLTIGISKSF